MSKSKRIDNRIKRLEKRFRDQIAKGKKGTDMDIELHERRIARLKAKSPLNFQLPANPGNLNMRTTSVNPNGRNYGAFSFLPSTMARVGMQVAGNNTKPGFGRFSEIFGRPSIFNQPQTGTPQQAAAFNAQQDSNNASATGFMNTDPHNMMMNPGLAQVATGAPGSASGNFSDGSLGYRVNKYGGFAGPTGGGTVPVNVGTENNFTDQYSFNNTSSVPVTTGGMSPQSQGVANSMFGDTLTRQRIMDPNTMVDQRQNNLRPNQLLEPQSLIN